MIKKRLLLSCLVFLFLSHFSLALLPDITDYFQEADSVYLVHVDADEKGKLIFSVIEILRGRAMTVLHIAPRTGDFTKNTDWLFLSCAGWRKGEERNVAARVAIGDFGWIYSQVIREGDIFYLPGVTYENNRQVYDKDLTGRGLPCLTLEHVKRILKNPESPSLK